ncbi:hypothetical protein PVAND_014064 [Polypedilum vanderplanki]|uniref:Dynein axonemal light chain 1 n=1 Tax=Polypedilum vanderplanki TaxID=319348 RepID=A0A9J6CT30_POLVA|nr:hypothetical protein PVAND_014064 [Polypedilum vanderplanki]
MSQRPTTIKEAIERWEKENEIKASEAKDVGLQFQIPPIERMNFDLAILVNCEKLSLSTNNIDRILLPPSLKNLKILALGRNNIKTLIGLEVLAETLEELWISYNSIDKLRGIEVMKNLKKFYIAHNNVRDWSEFMRLSELKENLRELIFIGNPLVENIDKKVYRNEIFHRLPFLKMLDGELLFFVTEFISAD